MVDKKLDYSRVVASFQDMENERSEWTAEYRQISDYLLPGRGIYQTYAKPRKRKLTSTRVINTVAEDSLYVLTSGMHGALTSPSRPWFNLSWGDPKLDEVEPLKAWLQDCTTKIHQALQVSNFYSIINSFYIEYAGFGTGCIYVGEDTEQDDVPVRFELLTAGEYVFSTGVEGKAVVFGRTIFMTPIQHVERFPDTSSKELKKMVKDNTGGAATEYVTVLEYIIKEPHGAMPFTQVFYDITASGTGGEGGMGDVKEPLEVKGFHEFPYPVARWQTIGSDTYGIGPGSRSLPDVKRIQEMEKSFLMAVHKAINPPLNVPGRMRGKTNTLPGGKNYYSNPQETINEIYNIRFDYAGVSNAVERVEQRIQKNFFNDIFLTGSRDPNASPLRTGQVQVQEQEKALRMGPIVERLQSEFYTPIIERVFNIMLRKEKFLPLAPEYAQMVGEYQISLVSPLATAQRAAALSGINSFMGFLGQAAQFDQQILDNINVDEAAREYADFNGVPLGILRPQEDVDKIRSDRQKAQQAQQQKEEQAAMTQMGSGISAEQAGAAKTQAEAGQINLESSQIAQEIGMV